MPDITIIYKDGKVSASPEIGQTDRIDQKIKWLLNSDDPNIVFAANGIAPIPADGPPPPMPPPPPPAGTSWSDWPSSAVFTRKDGKHFECDLNYPVPKGQPAQWYRYMVNLTDTSAASARGGDELEATYTFTRFVSEARDIEYDPDIENQPKP
jgi:hypothetical protein